MTSNEAKVNTTPESLSVMLLKAVEQARTTEKSANEIALAVMFSGMGSEFRVSQAKARGVQKDGKFRLSVGLRTREQIEKAVETFVAGSEGHPDNENEYVLGKGWGAWTKIDGKFIPAKALCEKEVIEYLALGDVPVDNEVVSALTALANAKPEKAE